MGGHEGARQRDFGRRHLGLCGVPVTAPRMKHRGIDTTILSAAGNTVTCDGPPGCHVSSPEENGAEPYR